MPLNQKYSLRRTKMKNLFYLLICCLILIACDNQILDPNLGDTPELNKRGSPDELIIENKILPRKTYKVVPMLSEYAFDPNNDCGGFLYKCNTKYSYENDRERRIKNLKIYSPSKLVVDGKVYKTYNIYTINRYELLSEKGAIVAGHTWGTFKIHKVKDEVIFDEDKVIKYDHVTRKPLEDLGGLLFSGEFTGNISGKRIEMKLHGKGSNAFSGKSLVAEEKTLCSSGMMCWRSKLSGKIKRVEYIDE
jgi:hypothetical protein